MMVAASLALLGVVPAPAAASLADKLMARYAHALGLCNVEGEGFESPSQIEDNGTFYYDDALSYCAECGRCEAPHFDTSLEKEPCRTGEAYDEFVALVGPCSEISCSAQTPGGGPEKPDGDLEIGEGPARRLYFGASEPYRDTAIHYCEKCGHCFGENDTTPEEATTTLEETVVDEKSPWFPCRRGHKFKQFENLTGGCEEYFASGGACGVNLLNADYEGMEGGHFHYYDGWLYYDDAVSYCPRCGDCYEEEIPEGDHDRCKDGEFFALSGRCEPCSECMWCQDGFDDTCGSCEPTVGPPCNRACLDIPSSSFPDALDACGWLFWEPGQCQHAEVELFSGNDDFSPMVNCCGCGGGKEVACKDTDNDASKVLSLRDGPFSHFDSGMENLSIGCRVFNNMPFLCHYLGSYNDDDFTPTDMCCACRGGEKTWCDHKPVVIELGPVLDSCANESTDCSYDNSENRGTWYNMMLAQDSPPEWTLAMEVDIEQADSPSQNLLMVGTENMFKVKDLGEFCAPGTGFHELHLVATLREVVLYCDGCRMAREGLRGNPGLAIPAKCGVTFGGSYLKKHRNPSSSQYCSNDKIRGNRLVANLTAFSIHSNYMD